MQTDTSEGRESERERDQANNSEEEREWKKGGGKRGRWGEREEGEGKQKRLWEGPGLGTSNQGTVNSSEGEDEHD
jgi:hypothetical protein